MTRSHRQLPILPNTAKPTAITPGLFDTLSPEQKAKALAYRGAENHGTEDFRIKPISPERHRGAPGLDTGHHETEHSAPSPCAAQGEATVLVG